MRSTWSSADTDIFTFFLLVLISVCVCRRPSWKPKTKPNGHFSMAGWFCFWCSTRLLMSVKKCSIWRRKGCNGQRQFLRPHLKWGCLVCYSTWDWTKSKDILDQHPPIRTTRTFARWLRLSPDPKGKKTPRLAMKITVKTAEIRRHKYTRPGPYRLTFFCR